MTALKLRPESLMVKDWVILPDDTTHRVNAVMQRQAGVYDKDGVLIWYNKSMLRPVPITTEVLEKNFTMTPGWAILNNAGIYCRFYLCNNFCVIKGKRHFKGTINHVHQLQHALRLCGCDDI